MSNGSWEKIYVEQGRVQVEILDSVVEAAELFSANKCRSILDLGCGTGRNTLYLVDRGFDVHACDISESGVEITKKLLSDKNTNNVEYSIQDMYSMTLENDLFDGVLCIWVQGHGTRDEVKKGIKEIYRVLKPGGIVVTDFVTVEDSTYGVGEEIDVNTFVGGRPGEEGIPHYYTTRGELEEMFSDFSRVDMRDKVYRFHDNEGNLYEITALLVAAIK